MSETKMENGPNPGTFKVKVPQVEIHNREFDGNPLCVKNSATEVSSYETVKIRPLSENDKAQRWRQVLPKRRKIGENKYGQSKYNTKFLTMPLIRLPEHLWSKLQFRFTSNDFDEKNLYVRDNIYEYDVSKTPYDDDVRELLALTKLYSPNLDRVREIVERLEEGEQYGWVLIRAKKLL
jgi:hypothetical protein